jgi:hypothetical protein
MDFIIGFLRTLWAIAALGLLAGIWLFASVWAEKHRDAAAKKQHIETKA